jgi:hypothetical protein
MRAEFGKEQALRYLVGEKFLAYLRTSDREPALRDDLPRLVAEVRAMFNERELREYFSGVRRLGATAHLLTEAEHAELVAAGVLKPDVVRAAEDVILLERTKRMLLPM